LGMALAASFIAMDTIQVQAMIREALIAERQRFAKILLDVAQRHSNTNPSSNTMPRDLARIADQLLDPER
jgi:hypothetical protein